MNDDDERKPPIRRRYARVTLSDAAARDYGRRILLLEAASFDGPLITGLVVDRAGNAVERETRDADGTEVVQRELLVLAREDLKRVVPLALSLKYGELLRPEDLPDDDPARGR